MLNILSVKLGTVLSGQLINDWCQDQIINRKSHMRDALRLDKKNYRNDREYFAIRIYPHERGPSTVAFMRKQTH